MVKMDKPDCRETRSFYSKTFDKSFTDYDIVGYSYLDTCYFRFSFFPALHTFPSYH
jgi:hypothetical protein